MVQQFLLPCECGRSSAVTPAQAGRTMACACGRDLRVPTLAGLRKLESAAEEKPVNARPASNWSAPRGIMFVAGVLMAVAGLAAGAYASYVVRAIDVDFVETHFAQGETEDIKTIDSMEPVETLELWNAAQEWGLGDPGNAQPVIAKRVNDTWLRLAIVSFCVAAAGIALAGASLIRLPVKA